MVKKVLLGFFGVFFSFFFLRSYGINSNIQIVTFCRLGFNSSQIIHFDTYMGKTEGMHAV